MTNISFPPPFSTTDCICAEVNKNIACVKWTPAEWIVTTSLCSTAFGICVAIGTYVLKKHYFKPAPTRIRAFTDLSMINENDSIPDLARNSV